MRRFVLLLAVPALAACSEQAARTYSVDELVADEALLSGLITWCRTNPGELRHTTNCRNADAADGKMRLLRMREPLRD